MELWRFHPTSVNPVHLYVYVDSSVDTSGSSFGFSSSNPLKSKNNSSIFKSDAEIPSSILFGNGSFSVSKSC